MKTVHNDRKGKTMLEVSHVTKRYRKVCANDDINLTIPDGEIGVLLGPNGAGKAQSSNVLWDFSNMRDRFV